MCLAILKPAKLVIPEEHLQSGWQGNSDGGGFAYVRNNKVVIEKGFMKYQDFLTAYNKAFAANKKSPFLIHFRIGTSGDRSKDNTHPFPITGGALIHNGGFAGTDAKYSSGPSDTCLFAQRYKDVLTMDFVKKAGDKLVSALGHNKVITLYDDGTYAIINEKAGSWVNDIWYSNSSFRSYSRPTGTATTPYRPPSTVTTTPATTSASEDYYEKHYGAAYGGMYGAD